MHDKEALGMLQGLHLQHYVIHLRTFIIIVHVSRPQARCATEAFGSLTSTSYVSEQLLSNCKLMPIAWHF